MTDNILTIIADIDENGGVDIELKANGTKKQVATVVAAILTEIGRADTDLLLKILEIHQDDYKKYVKEKLENE